MFLSFIKYTIAKKLALFLNHSFTVKHVFIMLTNKCNLSCIMCPLFGKYGIWKNPSDNFQLNLETIRLFIDSIAKYKPMILLTGGEPLLCNEWYSIAKYIKYKKLSCNISTNGCELLKYRNEIIATIDNLDVALDGTRDVHNKIRGKEVFDKIIEGLKEIDKLRDKTPNIKISFTINNKNYRTLEEFANYIDSLCIKIKNLIFRHPDFTSPELINEHKILFKHEFNLNSESFDGYLYTPDEVDIDVLINQMNNLKKTKFKYIKRISFEPNIRVDEVKNFYKDCKFIPKRFNICYAPYLGVMVTPQGNVWLCPDYVIGNLKEDNFEVMWNNDKSKKLRSYIRENKLFPICHSCASLYIY